MGPVDRDRRQEVAAGLLVGGKEKNEGRLGWWRRKMNRRKREKLGKNGLGRKEKELAQRKKNPEKKDF